MARGRPLAYDLATMPHLLIAGSDRHWQVGVLEHDYREPAARTPAGRMPDDSDRPEEVELIDYAQIPHLMTPVVTKDEKAAAILAWAVERWRNATSGCTAPACGTSFPTTNCRLKRLPAA